MLGEVEASGLRVPHHQALDFGCGVGRLTQALAEHFERVAGVDIAASMIARARQENRHGDRVRYVVNERSDLAGLGSERFDLILSLLVLQHMEPAYALGYVAEWTCPGSVDTWVMPPGAADATGARRPAG